MFTKLYQERNKIIAMLMVLFICFVCFPVTAISDDGVVAPDKFDGLEEDGAYLGAAYRDNYSLDIKDLGLLEAGDGIMNGIANVIFSLMKLIVYIVVTVFYYCMSFDIAALFGTEIDAIQSSLVGGIFNVLFLFGVGASLFYMAAQILKKNTQEVFVQFAKIIGISVLSVFITLFSSSFLSTVTTVTKAASLTALGELSDTSMADVDMETYSAQTAGILWGNMLHRPWIALEFGSYTPTDEEIETLLSYAPGSDERQDYVNTMNEAHGIFNKSVGGGRIGMGLLLLMLTIVKGGVFLLIGGMQLAYQLLTIIYLLVCPIVLFLALVPQFGGVSLINKWFKKIFEVQLSVLILSFLLGVIIKIDKLLFALSPTYGWLIILVLQILVIVGIVVFRRQILAAVGFATFEQTETNKMISATDRSINRRLHHRTSRQISRAISKRNGSGSGNERVVAEEPEQTTRQADSDRNIDFQAQRKSTRETKAQTTAAPQGGQERRQASAAPKDGQERRQAAAAPKSVQINDSDIVYRQQDKKDTKAASVRPAKAVETDIRMNQEKNKDKQPQRPHMAKPENAAATASANSMRGENIAMQRHQPEGTTQKRQPKRPQSIKEKTQRLIEERK